MKRNSLLAGISTAAMAMLFSQAIAQDDPEEEVEPRFKLNEVTFGFTTFKGNRLLNQYASPIDGLALHSLSYLSPMTETSPFVKFIVRGMPDQDNIVDGYTSFNNGNTVVSASRRQYGRSEVAWQPRSISAHDETNVSVEQAITPSIGGFLSYRSVKRGNHYTAPRGPDQTETQTVGGGVSGMLDGGNFHLSFNDRRTFTDTGQQPTTSQQGVTASYSRDVAENINLGGTALFSHIEQFGQLSNNITAYKLNGLWNVGPKTGMQFQFMRQDSDINSVMNAYVRKRLVTNARLIHRLPGWTAQFSYNHKETERVRSDHLFVDVPKTDGYELRLSGKAGPVRVKLRGSWENVSNDAVMGTDDPRRLYWGDRSTYQARLEGGGENFTAYGGYTFRLNQNTDRGVEIGWHNIAVGGSYVFNPELFGYAEISYDYYRVLGTAEGGLSLDGYFPDSRTFAVGADWVQSPELSASANLNFYESGTVGGTQLTFSVRRTLSADSSFELVVAPWNRNDREFDLTSFHSTFFSARFTTRF